MLEDAEALVEREVEGTEVETEDGDTDDLRLDVWNLDADELVLKVGNDDVLPFGVNMLDLSTDELLVELDFCMDAEVL